MKKYTSHYGYDTTVQEQIADANKYSFSKLTYIYLMINKDGLTKIGKSDKPRIRERTLQSKDPSVKLIFAAAKIARTEKMLHEAYADKRITGEWFMLDEKDVQDIKFMLG